MTLLTAFEPIWLLAAAGYAARRWRLLGAGWYGLLQVLLIAPIVLVALGS